VTPIPVSFCNVTHLARFNILPIHQTFKIQARQAVRRPFSTYSLPKAPGLAPRFAFGVGLGTARNFYSSRPIFHNLVENVPVSLRIFTEVDCELRTKGKRPVKMTERKETTDVNKTKEMIKLEYKVQSVPGTQVESDHHSTASPAEVTSNPPSLSPPHGLDEDTPAENLSPVPSVIPTLISGCSGTEEERAEPKARKKKQADAEAKKERGFRKNEEFVWVPSGTRPSLRVTGQGYEMSVNPRGQTALRLTDCPSQLSPSIHPRGVGQGTTRGW
jgi:hypothetical protein